MSKISVNVYCFKDLDTKSKIDLIKNLGYDEFFVSTHDVDDTIKMEEQISYAKSISLGLTMIHCSYIPQMLNDFWLDSEIGDEVEKSYIEQIERCGKYTDNFVVHLHGDKNSITSQIGIERIKRILKVCEKYNCNLAVENLFSYDEIPYIFKNISHPLLKICFDCWHRNFLTKNFDVLKDFGEFVSCLHLHDNHGLIDEHNILGSGNINLKSLAEGLKNKNLVLSAEVKFKEGNIKELLEKNKIALLNLNKMIMECENKK